jgi:CheY-like chemotaxis protein
MTPTKFQTIPLSELTKKGIAPDTTPVRPVVLVVDDEWIIADTLVAILNRVGYAAVAAYDGESALQNALLIPPAMLITDVVMPGMSGIELAIAVTEVIPDCRILLFSGQAATSDLLEDARIHGHEFTILTKPVHPSDLLAHVSRFVLTTSEDGAHPSPGPVRFSNPIELSQK